MPHVLVIDDDSDSAETLAMLIASEGLTVATAGSLRDARRQLALQTPDLVMLDLVLPDGNGLELLEDTRGLPHTEVVLVTGHASLDTSIQALRRGAADYLVKPVAPQQLQKLLSRISAPCPLHQDVQELENKLESEGHFGALWGRSPAMRRVYEQVMRVACTNVTVFVTGESGTGKEVVARTVHDLSRRRARPFLAVNCGAISPQLIESEIFGHEKGSFTGADRQHQGFFERASGGTLFLDEITEMPLDLQVKLLRVLETGTFMRVGSTTVQQTDVRLVAATNRDPMEAVKAGRLREDLFYRLNVFPIVLSPLRERAEDIPLLAQHFLDQVSKREGQRKQFAPATVQRLQAYRWPGNVRELRNMVCRAYVMATDTLIHDACLPGDAVQPSGSASAPSVPSLTIQVGTALAEIERRVTLATLEYLGNHKEKTAAALGISLKTLYNRLKEYAALPEGSLAKAAVEEGH
ncbi:MAG: sigma-54-dependent Fis family transcriptional regulator [Rhizobacter sp.]|nr:sigma-54-dependent Fis family transcriptional regulator [Rhizobacter sp.]